MVFSWGHRTQRRINWHKRGRSRSLTGCRQEREWSRSHLETESEPSLRLWRCRAVARFLISNFQLRISDSEIKSLDQFRVFHKGTQRFGNHDRAVSLLVILK
jgi:hypothetical protein